MSFSQAKMKILKISGAYALEKTRFFVIPNFASYTSKENMNITEVSVLQLKITLVFKEINIYFMVIFRL